MNEKTFVDPDNPKETIEFAIALWTLFKLQADVREGGIGLDDAVKVIAAAPTVARGFFGIKYIDDEQRVVTDRGEEVFREKMKETIDFEDPATDALIEDIAEYVRAGVNISIRVIDLVRNREMRGYQADVESME